MDRQIVRNMPTTAWTTDDKIRELRDDHFSPEISHKNFNFWSGIIGNSRKISSIEVRDTFDFRFLRVFEFSLHT